MKLGHVVLAVLIFAAGAYWVYDVYTQQETRIRELEAQLRALRSGAGAQPAPVHPAGQSWVDVGGEPKRVVCPACGGEGRLMVRLKGGQDKSYACPVCGSLGYKADGVPAGGSTCPDCRGIGRRVYSQKQGCFVPFEQIRDLPYAEERLVARPCMRCGGTGCLRVPPAR